KPPFRGNNYAATAPHIDRTDVNGILREIANEPPSFDLSPRHDVANPAIRLSDLHQRLNLRRLRK
ncbi:MAG: hypothetical protein ACK5BN_18855, partial [Planctomycetota bacterium]